MNPLRFGFGEAGADEFHRKGERASFREADSTSIVEFSRVPSFGTLRFLASKICHFDVDRLARFFAKDIETKTWIRERALLPTASSPLPDCNLQNQQRRGETERFVL